MNQQQPGKLSQAFGAVAATFVIILAPIASIWMLWHAARIAVLGPGWVRGAVIAWACLIAIGVYQSGKGTRR